MYLVSHILRDLQLSNIEEVTRIAVQVPNTCAEVCYGGGDLEVLGSVLEGVGFEADLAASE